jgi:hypothetical protein
MIAGSGRKIIRYVVTDVERASGIHEAGRVFGVDPAENPVNRKVNLADVES